MALLLDGQPSSIEDLGALDSDLLSVAASEGIDLAVKLQLASAAISRTVETMLMSAAPSHSAFPQRFPTLRHIAVTSQLKLWHTYLTLRLVYQDLYYTRLNDRYQAKMNLYREEEAQALDDLRATGLGVVFDPLSQALAPHIATVTTQDPGGTMFVAVTMVNQRGEESLISVPAQVDTQDGNAASITIIGLADNAVGWNVYAGLAPDALAKQNDQPLDPLASATLAPGRLASGPNPGDGQHANRLYPVPKRILRG